MAAAVRSGPGTPLPAAAVTDWVPSDDDPDDDPEIIEAAIEFVTPAWHAVGIADTSDRLTPAGGWLLPRALLRDLGHDFDTTD